MNRDQRTDFQVFSAIGMLVVGTALAIAGFIVPPTGEISDSVLNIFAQCLIYAGSIFGIGIYVNGKFTDIKKYIQDKLGSPDDPISREAPS